MYHIICFSNLESAQTLYGSAQWQDAFRFVLHICSPTIVTGRETKAQIPRPILPEVELPTVPAIVESSNHAVLMLSTINFAPTLRPCHTLR